MRHKRMSNAQINLKHCTASLYMDLNLLNNASEAECNYALLVLVNTSCSYMSRQVSEIKWTAFIPAHRIPTGTLYSYRHTVFVQTHCIPTDTLYSYRHTVFLQTHCIPTGTPYSYRLTVTRGFESKKNMNLRN